MTTGRLNKVRNKQNHDTEESETITRKENEHRPEKVFQEQEAEEKEVVMMCWENMEGGLAKVPNEETGGRDGRADDEMEKPKYEEECSDHTLHTGN